MIASRGATSSGGKQRGGRQGYLRGSTRRRRRRRRCQATRVHRSFSGSRGYGSF